MNLTYMRTLVRRDLKDEDANNYRWTDEEIDRAIQRAVQELSLYIPRELTTDLPTTEGSYQIDISSLAQIGIVRVEYPIGEEPPVYRRFSVWGNTVTLREGDPGDGTDARIYYRAQHSITTESSTVPGHLEHMVALGAAAHAVLALAQYVTETAGIGGIQADRDLREWGHEMYERFISRLEKEAGGDRVKTSTLYVDEG